MITDVAFSLLNIFCHVNSSDFWPETLFSELFIYRHMVLSSFGEHKLVYLSSFTVLINFEVYFWSLPLI